jgi:hypothetical protein
LVIKKHSRKVLPKRALDFSDKGEGSKIYYQSRSSWLLIRRMEESRSYSLTCSYSMYTQRYTAKHVAKYTQRYRAIHVAIYTQRYRAT